MTTAEMLAEVTAQIRKDVPRTMEFREGCIIESSGEMFKVIHIFENYPERTCLINLKNKGIYSGKFTYPVDRLESFINHPYKVIGHDIMLNDVLEWLKINDFPAEFQENGDFNLYRILDGGKSSERYEFVNWILPKVFLKDQQERLIKFLYDLKQKIDE